jgi:hypothetical protein
MMNSLSNSQIDEAVLAATVTSWRKVARVIALVAEALSKNLPQREAGLDLVAGRIEALVQDGRLLAQGDVKKWRHSEVRKPDLAAYK